MKAWIYISSLVIIMALKLPAQIEVDGLASSVTTYAPQAEAPVFLGLRYIPSLKYENLIDTNSVFGFEGAINFDAGWRGEDFTSNIRPYRLWAKYASRQFEIRGGLQKIEFGSAKVLRPLQWFNQIDPRDPLSLTYGVYGLLGRYYFLNNANIWLWGLYGNEGNRGLDAIETNAEIPEFGGRIQYPVIKGELAFTYHRRSANGDRLFPLMELTNVPEHRFGLDGKWDLGVGLWFETSYQHKTVDLGSLTNIFAGTLGIDYTFGLGNGLNAMLEHMILSADEELFSLGDPIQLTALTLSYPLTFFDQISLIGFSNWVSGSPTFLVNYEHQFKYFSMYVLAFYNPDTQSGIQQNDLVNAFQGPGLSIMLVYKH